MICWISCDNEALEKIRQINGITICWSRKYETASGTIDTQHLVMGPDNMLELIDETLADHLDIRKR